MTNKIHLITLLAALAVGCGQGKKAEQFQALPFPQVTPPGMMTDAQDVAVYMAERYWDGITDPSRTYPSDSLLVSGVSRDDVEQKFADWTSILSLVPLQKADKAISRLYDRALACEKADTSSNVFETFNDLAYKYLYDPNSPMRNEDHYWSYVRKLAGYQGFSEEMRKKYAFDASMCALNRVGTIAADFRFADKAGNIRTLHSIDAPLTLLFFSNPGCTACMEIINVLKNEPRISEMISSGALAVLNIYIDEDLQAWLEYMPVYPQQWYNGFDPDLAIRSDRLYNVRAIPSLYLLGSDKSVLLKDAVPDKVFSFLHSEGDIPQTILNQRE
jgi:hypothetical protein